LCTTFEQAPWCDVLFPFIISLIMHIPVLQKTVEKYLDLNEGEYAVDCTLGLGGHSKDILRKIGEKGKLFAFDQDERNLIKAKENLKEYTNQIVYFHDNFCDLQNRLGGENVGNIDAVLLDLGLSSPHVDDAERGFSFINDGPLDMRFDQRTKLTAADVVNSYPEKDLMIMFFEYGDEKASRKLARLICERREEKRFETTMDLANFIEKVYPKKRVKKSSRSHPATKVFQALRIEVNNELSVLNDVLKQLMNVLKIGGRVVIISYHSLEDRIVKKYFNKLLKPKPSLEQENYQNFGDPIVEKITKKPLVPDDEELALNPRSRSAKLRVYKKILNINS